MHYIKQFFETLLTPFLLLFTAPQQLIATPRKLLGLSLPARIAVLLLMFLVLSVVLVYWVRFRHDRGEIVGKWLEHLPIMIVLVIVTPAVTYQALKLWLEGESSAFEDIDRAWQAGMAELERNGLSISQSPLFLVVGSAGEFQEKALFAASRLSLTVNNFPSGPSALHWYANPNAVFLVASDVGCMSKVAALGEAAADKKRQQPAGPVEAAAFNPHGGTMQMATPSVRDTAPLPAGAAQAVAKEPSAPADYRGTMMVPAVEDMRMTAVVAGAPGAAAAAQPTHIKLSREEFDRQPRRLEYLCGLIRRARQPYCPVNGMLTLLPYRVVQWGKVEALELQKAARSDLSIANRVLRLRCPVTALVTGMETESGFGELVKRVGPERARVQRFGKGFKVWDRATPEQLSALCTHACGAFEVFIYELFKEADALTSTEKSPGNRRLYSLLCKIRRDVQPRLDGVLADGFANETDQDPQAQPLLFGGCYFAATGGTESHQAFVKSVFEKLIEEQEELEWTSAMLREDAWYRKLAYAGFTIDVALLLGAASLALAKWK